MFVKPLKQLLPRLWIPMQACRLTSIRHLSEAKVPESQPLNLKPRRRQPKGPLNWKSFAGTVATFGFGIYVYYRIKQEKLKELQTATTKSVGKPLIGGPFQLIDHNGKPKSDKDFLGKWAFIYFGFTHCPDICPDEMEKICEAYDALMALRKKDPKAVDDIVPIFITVDPERDTPEIVKNYIDEFHPDMIGLTGDFESVLAAAKAYRVYMSAGPRDDDNDYIVDHTIITYLIDPEGNFVKYYGQRDTANKIITNVQEQMARWQPKNSQ